MTLKEAIEAQEDGYVYISAKSAFEWMGKKEDAISGVIDASEKKYNQIIRQAIPDYVRKIKMLSENIKEINYEIRAIKNGDEDVLKEKWEESQELALKLESLLKNLIHTIEYMKNWTDYLDREVVDMYPRQYVEPLGTIIKIEGEENGSYWMIEEMKKGD